MSTLPRGGSTPPSSEVSDVHHIGVLVADVDAAVTFVEAAFGLAVDESVDDPSVLLRSRLFNIGSVQLELFERGDHATRRAQLAGAPARLDHVALAVSGLDAAIERLAAAGARTEAAPIEFGGWRMAFVDPATAHGIRYQLMEQLG